MKPIKPTKTQTQLKLTILTTLICIAITAITTITTITILTATTTYAIEIFFEHNETQQLSRGITYNQNRLMTSRGMLDVHVLYVDLDEPFITLAPVTSSREWGLRETTSRLLSDAGALAGVNADFFNMSRLYSTYFGPMVRDGQVLSLNADINRDGDELAAFFLDMRNNPFFMYMKTNMQLYANHEFLTNVVAYNSIGSDIFSPVVVSRAAMESTADIDARVLDTTKVVVQNNYVTQVSTHTVATPENGFVIIIPRDSLPYYARFLTVGTHVRFNVGTDINVDFSSIRAAIGGGAVVLLNGEIVQGGGVQPNQRHPRTAVGATRDGRIMLVTVDGRTHSIGVTHTELGEILRHYGAINAMHMDGGGSTTMVTSEHGEYSVVNTPSDGGQRRVVNALGVFDTSTPSEMVSVAFQLAEQRAITGVPVTANVFGLDAYENRLPLVYEPLFFASPEDGVWHGRRYTPLRTGTHTLMMTYGEQNVLATLEVFSLAELQPHNQSVNLFQGGRVPLRFSGTATDGTHVNLPEVSGLAVFPSSLGTFDNGEFVASRGGVGYIEASVGSIKAYIPVSVGGFPWPVDMLGSPSMEFQSTPPELVSTKVSIETVQEHHLIRLDYSFGRTTETQASYVTFYPALEIAGEPVALRMQVYGDGSGHWLRGRVFDGNGTSHNIDFARTVDFEGWETVTAILPANAPPPFSIDRIYMASLENNEPSTHRAYFYRLEALYVPNNVVEVPQGTVFQDRLRVVRNFGESGMVELAVPDNAEFKVSAQGNIAVATITASGGGIQSTNVDQWKYLMPSIRALQLPYAVIVLDKNPLDFTRRMEYELLHLAMKTLRDEGMTVFVVSKGEAALTMRDNIRYVTTEDSIRLWANGGEIRWAV
ncbi:MAG: phosphodiester glycosidase family protein [Defluviitaleaceae bacterium]|nr:phosphodiester glycosidase family protein [Defluviitaleaceae bacterium]